MGRPQNDFLILPFLPFKEAVEDRSPQTQSVWDSKSEIFKGVRGIFGQS